MTRRLRDVAVALLVPVVTVVVWWFASAGSTSPFYPPLSTIVRTFRETWVFARFDSDVVPSLERMFAGFGLAVMTGVAVGAALGHSEPLRRAFSPLLQFFRAIPAVAMVPVSIALLGIGDLPKIILIAFVCVPPILLNTIDGVRGVDPLLYDVSKSYRLTPVQRVLAVQLPSAAPQIFAGLRIALGIALVMMVVSEMVAATNGIGYLTLNAQQSLQVPEMWSGMILLGLLGAGFSAAFMLLERRLLPWHFRDDVRGSDAHS